MNPINAPLERDRSRNLQRHRKREAAAVHRPGNDRIGKLHFQGRSRSDRSVFTNKYAEGYPGRRYYGGCEFVDVVESLAIERAKKLFGAEHANVQPHSGSQANMSVYLTVLKPGDTVMGMNLSHGGHLTHGHPLNFSGKYYNFVPYGVRKDTETIDYEELERLARQSKPRLIIVGASAYPRAIDFERICEDRAGNGIADDGGYRPHRGAGRGRRTCITRPACGIRHQHDAQDAARAAQRRGAVPAKNLPRT